MVSNTTPHTNTQQLVNSENFHLEYRSSSGVGIIKWTLPAHTDLRVKEDHFKTVCQKLYKDFLARFFIDLDVFIIPSRLIVDDSEIYNLPKGRSKVRFDTVGDCNVLVCQWHLPSYLVEYFNSDTAIPFKDCWDLNQLAETFDDYLGKR